MNKFKNQIEHKKNKVFFSAIPSTFFFFYWIVTIISLITTYEFLVEISSETVPEITVDQFKAYREAYIGRERINDVEITKLLNQNRLDGPSSYMAQSILFCVSVIALGILILTTVGGHEILKLN